MATGSSFGPAAKGVYDLYVKPSTLGRQRDRCCTGPRTARSPTTGHPMDSSSSTSTQDPNTGNDLYVWPVDDEQNRDRKPRPFLQTPFDESQGVFSPDGHWIAYQSNEGGPTEVYVQPFPGPGGKQQISLGGRVVAPLAARWQANCSFCPRMHNSWPPRSAFKARRSKQEHLSPSSRRSWWSIRRCRRKRQAPI